MLNATVLWLIAGMILCLMEFTIPTAFVEFMLGIAALLVAAISLFVPQFSVQVVLWIVLSTALIFLSRRFFTPKRRAVRADEDREGKTLTEIYPGETGRILYEGNSWRAKCADEAMAIAPNQKVYIVGREGNTLVVLPRSLLDS
ncbi:MAG: NfeD family protein [Cyanophyceae cyanobacterium]